MASINSDWNYLGIDIRQALILSAERERNKLDIKNLKFLYCNANVSLSNWMSVLNSGQLKIVSIQFPDPWFKKRHYKRRVLQPALLLSIASALEPGSKLFIQSDLLEIIQSMVSLIESSNLFNPSCELTKKLIIDNPFDYKTEREKYVLSQKLPIYRALFSRNTEPLIELSSLEEKFNELTNNIKD